MLVAFSWFCSWRFSVALVLGKFYVLALKKKASLLNSGREKGTSTKTFCSGEGPVLSGTGDSQRDSRESIRANHSQLKPLFL